MIGAGVPSKIRLDDLYDAATDDAQFARLPSIMADALDARSGVLHWRCDPGSGSAEIAHTGYFSEEDFARYDGDFAAADIWGVALRQPENRNRAVDCGAIVPDSSYDRSRIYNEWVRAIGDDSYFCLGAATDRGGILAEMGFHRGRRQGAFCSNALAILDDVLPHIQRVLKMRQRLNAATAAAHSASGALDVLDDAIFTLGAGGRLLHCNASAEAMISTGHLFRMQNGMLTAVSRIDGEALSAAIEQLLSRDGFGATSFALRSSRGEGLVLSLVATNPDGRGRRLVAVLSGRGTADTSLVARVRDLHGLTPAEAEVAVAVTQGESIQAIADARGVAVSTVRSHMKALSSKMGVSRQGEIAALIRRLPIFHANVQGHPPNEGCDRR